MKVGIVTTFWGREELARLWLIHAIRVRDRFEEHDIECEVYASGSQVVIETLCKKAGVRYLNKSNKHLGAKWNAAASLALEDSLIGGCDYILILGSDDFMSEGLVDKYAALIHEGTHPYVGLRSIYMAEPSTRRAMLLDGNKKHHPLTPGKVEYRPARFARLQARDAGLPFHRPETTLGAGRLLHRSLFANHEHFWEPQRNRGLDASMVRTLGLGHAHVLSSTPEAFIVDVKTTENIWSYDSLLEWYSNSGIQYPAHLASLPEWAEIAAL